MDSETSTNVFSDSDSDSPFKGKKLNSEYKYLKDDLSLTDTDCVNWDKCDGHGNCYHLVC